MMSAFICIINIELRVPLSQSLKDKRKQIKSLKDKIQNRFNASVAEIDYLDEWQRSVIGVSMISNDRVFLEKQYRAIETLLLEYHDVEVIRLNIEWL